MQLKFEHFVVLQVLDVITTWYGLTYLGLREANSFADGLFKDYGLEIGLVGLKVIGLIVIWVVLKSHGQFLKIFSINIKNEIETPVITLGCFLFVFVVANNIYQILMV